MQIKTETKVGLFVIIAIAIFIFMTLGIGAFRFGAYGYNPYEISFNDVSGLAKKANVKIAGVKVGWVEDLELTDTGKVVANIMVEQKYSLYDNAYAVVRQEGLIGTKYLEITPGDPMLPRLESGEKLARPGRESVSVDELLFKFKNIATHVEQVTDSIREAFSGSDKADQIRNTIENVSDASAKISKLANSLDNVISGNEENLNSILGNVSSFTQTLKEDLPSLKENMTRFTDAIENNFGNISGKLSESTDFIIQAAREAKDSFENISSVTQKIDEGHGLLGKLINEEEMYKDIKTAVSGLKSYITKFDSMSVIFDSHSETQQRPIDNFKFTDTRGYLNVRIHANDQFFYIGQLATSEKGFVSRKYLYRLFLDSRETDYKVIPYEELNKETSGSDISSDFNDYNRRAFCPQTIEQIRIPYAYGFQIGKFYKNFSLRVGLFEGTFGCGADYYIPLKDGKFSWITSFEMFDFKGLQRLKIFEQRRPHLKWINKIFIFNNLYTTMGADDFISDNGTLFWGFGIRFADNDIKYLLSKIGFGLPTTPNAA